MSLIDDGRPNGLDQLSKEEKQEITKKQIAADAYTAYNALVKAHGSIYKRVWQNNLGLTPQEVFDVLGSQGSELFRLSAILIQTVNTAKPGSISYTQPYHFTINPDGTVTVGDPI